MFYLATMEHDTFYKRPGTTDKGKHYEDYSIANLILKMVTDDKIDDFKLSSNDLSAGSFDDIVLELNTRKTYAMQLKHVNKDKVLTKQSLTEDSGHFSIKKYFKSIQQNKPTSCPLTLFVLYTNLKFDISDKEQISLVGFDGEIISCEPDPLLNTSDANGRCYKFNIKTENTDCKEFKQFVNNFFLYTDQTNVDKLKHHVMSSFEEKFCCDTNTAEKYLQFISQWSIREGVKEKLDKILMKRAIALLLSSPFIEPFTFTNLNENGKILQKAINQFRITVFRKESKDMVRGIWKDLKSELTDMKEINISKTRFQLFPRSIKNIEDVNDKISTILLWLMNKSPLIVVENNSTTEAIKLCQDKKFILLNDGNQEKFEGVFKNLSDLDPECQIYKEMLKSFKCSIQGKEAITLEMLINNREEIRKIITTNELIQMINCPLLIGEDKEILPTPYINRFLSRNVIDDKFLSNVDKETLVLISCIRKSKKIKRRLMHYNVVTVGDREGRSEQAGYDRPNIYVCKDECSEEDFQKICEENANYKNYHHLKVVDQEQLEWVKSKGNVRDLEGYRKDNYFIEESELYGAISTNNINIICADPGMGKTVLMKSFKNNLVPTSWTIVIYPRDISSFCLHFRPKRTFRPRITSVVDEFKKFIFNERCRTCTSFECNFLNYSMEKGQIVYIWDAVDESEQNLGTITHITLQLSGNSIMQWLTSRCHLKMVLEKKFNVLSRSISQFDDDQQNFYIEKRLKTYCSDNSIRDITVKIKRNITMIEHHDVLGIPLQVFMLTELFRENPNKYLDLFKNVFSLTDLYSHFIDEKFNFYYREKVKADEKNNHLTRILNKHKKYIFSEYEQAAMKMLFDEEILRKLNINCETFLEEIRLENDCFGIITEIGENNKPNFLHNSYGEFFAAVYFSKHHQNIPNFQDLIFEGKYSNIRLLFDLLLAEKCPAHIAVLCKNLNALKTYSTQLAIPDKGGRNPLQLACSWGERYPFFNVTTDGEEYIINDEETENVNLREESSEYREMLWFLLNRCNVYQTDDLFKMDSYTYARKCNCLLSLITLFVCQKIQKDNLSLELVCTILYYSARFGYDVVLDSFEIIPLIKTKEKRSSLLHISIEHNQERCFQKLIFNKTYKKLVNDQDRLGNSPLHIASKTGNKNIVEVLLKANAAIDICNKEGETPLFVASQNGHESVVRLLLWYGADVNKGAKNGWRPIHIASFQGHEEIIDLLIEKKADVNCVTKDESTPLYIACQGGNRKIAQVLVAAGSKVNKTTSRGWQPIHTASYNGNKELVQLLIASGAEINVPNRRGSTPIYLASQNGHDEVVRVLIAANANIHLTSNSGWSPIHIASQNGHAKVVELLLMAGAAFDFADSMVSTPVYLASQNGHQKVVELLINFGANVHLATTDGYLPLHIASAKGYSEIVKLLIGVGADVNEVNFEYATPVYLACQNGREEVVEILIMVGANVNVTSGNGLTPLFVACQYGYVNIVELLISSGARVDVVNEFGWTPLHAACKRGHERVAQKLIEVGVQIDQVTDTNLEPIHMACSEGHVKVLKVLIAAGANPNVSTPGGSTPAYIACKYGHEKVLEVLVAAGANLDIASNAGWKPIHIACKNGYKRIVQLLVGAGSSMLTRTAQGETAVTIARRYGQESALSEFLTESFI